MAYVPPHKRHSKDKLGTSPSPELPPSNFKKNQSVRSTHSHADRSGMIVHAKGAITKWFALGFHDDDDLHNIQLHLLPISLEFVERKLGEKPLILQNIHRPQDFSERHARSPWEVVAHNVLQDLLSSFENVRVEMKEQSLEEVKPILVARFGKILFHGAPSDAREAVSKSLVTGAKLRQFKKQFYTNIPTSYVDKMTKGDLQKIGLDFEEEKDLYHVKLSDSNRPNVIISCKCSIRMEQNKLLHYKIELNRLRHMVIDISCLAKNLDLRLMLCSKRVLTALNDDEMQCIQNLIESAVLDPNVKGGLRWPLGKASSGDRFSVVGVWHTITKAYSSPLLRMKVRHADRFDFHTSIGESSSEVYLKLKGIVSEVQAQKADIGSISKMLEDNLKLIWNHFLNCEQFLG